jgi:hypothetical protein
MVTSYAKVTACGRQTCKGGRIPLAAFNTKNFTHYAENYGLSLIGGAPP